MPAPLGPLPMYLYLVEQGLVYGYSRPVLAEAVVAAKSEIEAIEALRSMADPRLGLGVVIIVDRLTATQLGVMTAELPTDKIRWMHKDAAVLAVTTLNSNE